MALNSREDGCFFCGRMNSLELHHIFNAHNRKHSDEDGLTVYLCHWCHNEPPNGVHFNRENRLQLQRKAQEIYEQDHSHEEWLARYGKSYI